MNLELIEDPLCLVKEIPEQQILWGGIFNRN